MACISIWPNRIGRLLLDHNPSVETEQMELGQALFLAAVYGHVEVFQLLHDKGADLGFVVGDGYPIKPILAIRTIGKASIRGRAYIIKLLLKSGVDLEVKSEDGRSTLTIAASSGLGDAVRRLLGKGASSESFDPLGRTALHYAAFQSNCAILTSLADYNPSWLNHKDFYGCKWCELYWQQAALTVLSKTILAAPHFAMKKNKGSP